MTTDECERKKDTEVNTHTLGSTRVEKLKGYCSSVFFKVLLCCVVLFFLFYLLPGNTRVSHTNTHTVTHTKKKKNILCGDERCWMRAWTYGYTSCSNSINTKKKRNPFLGRLYNIFNHNSLCIGLSKKPKIRVIYFFLRLI